MEIKTIDKHDFLELKDIKKYKDKYFTVLTIPRRQRCFIKEIQEAEQKLKGERK